MLYLLLSILCATSLVVILRLFQEWKIKTNYGIVYNYLACCITGFVFMENKSLIHGIVKWNGLWICLFLGFCFIIIFTLIGKAVSVLGVAVTGIAYKLSFIIPAIAAILLYHDPVTVYKLLGIAGAVVAVYFISYEHESNIENAINKTGFFTSNIKWLLAVIIFIGAGFDDALYNFIQRNYTPPGYDHLVNITIFAGAFFSGFIFFGKNKELYRLKNMAGGILLGIPNYGSLYFLQQALKHSGYTASTLFPLNNLGIVCLSALAGLLFHESMSKRKVAGFLLAVASIIVIGFIH